MYMQKIFNHIELPEHIESLAEMKANTGGDGTRTYSTPVGNFPSVTTVVGWEKQWPAKVGPCRPWLSQKLAWLCLVGK